MGIGRLVTLGRDCAFSDLTASLGNDGAGEADCFCEVPEDIPDENWSDPVSISEKQASELKKPQARAPDPLTIA
eukprot:CAMPEP_0113662202 /NCGR_PEP_ID=MMETSP0038_2-20120614/430_1 /TAXON_ID=2898 /ORGANISM="Cryptomonas paramecium" /LENGTH=73 /DNA_ID=CAMNT_0000577041 /DNA_START=163 /DNA_END=384 /DNA_ORIENTATION=+ /assembly_acc=CAM_ASM_000170